MGLTDLNLVHIDAVLEPSLYKYVSQSLWTEAHPRD